MANEYEKVTMKQKRTIIFLTRLLAFIAFSLFAVDLYAIEIIAHRANGCGMTQNTLNAVRSASSAGFDAIELDVRVSSDGVVYLFHDDDIDDQPVWHLKYAAIQKLTGNDETPTLVSVLTAAKFEGFYILDLKQLNVDLVPYLVDAVTLSGLESEQVIFQCEDIKLLKAINDQLPANRYYLLERLKKSFPYLFAPGPDRILGKASADFIEGVSLKGRSFLDKAFVSKLKESGLRVFVWTINSSSRATHYKESGVDGIITDTPLAFLNLFEQSFGKTIACPGD